MNAALAGGGWAAELAVVLGLGLVLAVVLAVVASRVHRGRRAREAVRRGQARRDMLRACGDPLSADTRAMLGGRGAPQYRGSRVSRGTRGAELLNDEAGRKLLRLKLTSGRGRHARR